MDIQTRIGKQVASYRRAAGFSQEELAARIGLDQAYISRLEAGKLNITVSTLQLIADALDVVPSRLLEESALPAVT